MFSNVKVGDTILFGTYEQDNNTSNGKEQIEWIVLDIKDGKALVISKYVLDCKPFNTNDDYVTWETCTLRAWLNNDFINTAFTSSQKAIIPTVTVSADNNVFENTNQGNATQDKVFLLSGPETSYIKSVNVTKKCMPTEYAKANGVKIDNGNCNYWLRTLGKSRAFAAYIDYDGDYAAGGTRVYYNAYGVRPAIWIDISK
jgi:hypothetical protein